ncbi:MAG TPA: BON domain-containing protein [Polyangiaceae bacterium]
MPDTKSSAENQAPAAGPDPVLGALTRALNPVSHDVVLQIRILDQLKESAELDASDVSVVVRNRSATLFGTVPSEAQRDLAQRVTTAISGVIEVTNRLKTVTAKETP